LESVIPNHCSASLNFGAVHVDIWPCAGRPCEGVRQRALYGIFIAGPHHDDAFANSSSSLVQSKIMGNVVFLLLTPLSHWHWFVAYVGSSMLRGLAVGLGVFAVTVWFAPLQYHSPVWILVFAVLCAGLLGALGLVAGLWSEKFDQMAAFQSFVIMPMTFLSGVFYSIHSLPPFWQGLSHLNPFFYMIDGFRYGFFGQSDVSPWTSLAVVSVAMLAVSALAIHWLKSGYKIRG
jgi:ABC-2 type transport system permease protein